ncbi:MAG: lasso RiPP family leader peptide-containing protein [Thermoanaerobaculia bacterium]
MPNRPDASSPVPPDSAPVPDGSACSGAVLRWTKPVLSVHGDVRELTMGVSNPPGESGNEGSRRP